MSMSKSNGKRTSEVYDDKVVLVDSPLDLPYSYIPYYSLASARVNHPDDTLYVYEPGAPMGYRIIAFPVTMFKPKPEADNAE
jgi:hypothetical protein